jgi:hypothetical protein
MSLTLQILTFYFSGLLEESFPRASELGQAAHRTSWARSEAGLVESHLMARFGHYHHVMLYLARQFGWENKFVLDISSSSP